MESSGQRRLAAIMFTDMVGYSALTQQDEALAMRLLEEHFALLRSIFPVYEGSEIKTIGDAFLVEFSSALQAANCAVAIQKAVWERNQNASEQGPPILLRVGLHVGDIIHSEGDVFGDGVNIAARLEPCAPPGGICMSEDVARPIRNKIGLPLVSMGEWELKNITDPVHIYRVSLPWLPAEPESGADGGGVAGIWAGLKRRLQDLSPATLALPAAVVIVLLGVIVLMNLPSGSGGDPQVRRLALLPLGYAGPADRTVTAKMLPALLVESLRASPGLSVAPFESSREFSPEEDTDQVSRELNVDWVLRGDLAIQENRFDLDLTLLGAEEPAWSKQLRGELQHLFSSAEGLTLEIESALDVRQAPSAVVNRHPEAIQSYLEGKALLEGWDVQASFEKAQVAFSRATQLEPGFGEAYAGLALAQWGIWEESRDVSMVPLALEAARQAVSLAPSHPEAHLALGVIQLGQGHSQEAVLSFEQALKLAPADDAVCRRIGEAYSRLGRHQEAEQMFQRAIDLRPDFWQNHRAKGNFLYVQGRYEEAKQLYRKIVSLRPNSDVGYNNLGAVHLTLGEMDEAEANFKSAQAVMPTLATFSNLGFIYYSRGAYQAAAEQFRKAAEMGSNEIPWVNLGDAYRQLQQVDEANAAYQKAARMSLARLEVNPADSVTRAWLAYALAGSGQCGKATREASDAIGRGQSLPSLHYYAGVAFALCHQDQEAAAQIELAAEGGFAADVRTNPDLRRFLEQPRIKELLADPNQS